MKGISDVVVCENKRLDDLAEFKREHKQPNFCYMHLSVQFKSMSANPSNVTAQIVLSLPHCTYFHDFVGGEIWILCVSSYLA